MLDLFNEERGLLLLVNAIFYQDDTSMDINQFSFTLISTIFLKYLGKDCLLCWSCLNYCLCVFGVTASRYCLLGITTLVDMK